MEPRKKGGKEIVVLIVCILLYIACFVASTMMSRAAGQAAAQAAQAAASQGGPPAGAGGGSNAFNGVITQVQVIVSIVMVLLCKKKGFITGCILNGAVSLFVLFTQVIRAGNTNALPGVVVTAISIVIIGIIYYYVTKNEKINSELNDSYQKAIEQARLLQDKDESLRFLAYYDRLTSMPNRVLFMENIDDRINESKMTSIVYVDLDNFRNINDTFGHNLGDDLLVRYAEKINRLCGDQVFAAKIGGDEYGLILGEEYGADEIMAFVGGLAQVLSEPINIRGDIFSVTASFGVATFPTDTRSAEDLFRCAETAMFSAKANGKNQLCFYRR